MRRSVWLLTWVSSVAIATPGLHDDYFEDLPREFQPSDIGDTYMSPVSGLTYSTAGAFSSVFVPDIGTWALSVDSNDYTVVLTPDAVEWLWLFSVGIELHTPTELNYTPATWITVDNGVQSELYDLSTNLNRLSMPLGATDGAITLTADGGFGIFDMSYLTENDDDDDGWIASDGDCGPNDAYVNPDAYDLAGDGVDADCSGADAEEDFEAFVVMPSCPASGTLRISWRGATPGGQVMAVPSATPAPWWPGRRAGVFSCDVANLEVTPLVNPPTFTSSDAGTGYVEVDVGGATCGAWSQFIDLTTCLVSKPYKIQ